MHDLFDMQKNEISPIETDRLQLVSMPLHLLRVLSERKFSDAQKVSDFVLSNESSLAGKIWLKRRITMIEMDPSQHEWMYRAIVRRRDRQMVGYISFHHKAPDPDLSDFSDNTAELGYTIERNYRRCGYATESAVAMMEWANREHRVSEFILTISPSNVPSLRMADRMSFKVVGEKDDPVDGLEYFMKANIAEIRRAKKVFQEAVDNEGHFGRSGDGIG